MNKQWRWRRAVVVEDDASFARRLGQHLEGRGLSVEYAHSVAGGVEVIGRVQPDLVVMDFKLPDGVATDLMAHLRHLEPWPTYVAISGSAEPLDTFTLAQLGIVGYLQKPVTPAELDAALDTAHDARPDLVPALRAAVGQVPVRDVEQLARQTMVREAVARSRGNLSGAARMLSVSRQLLQHILRGLGH